jgi:hypothetical protein
MAKSDKHKRSDKAVKIARDLAVKAKMIAETRNITIAEYLSGLLRPLIEKDWPRAVQQLNDSDD